MAEILALADEFLVRSLITAPLAADGTHVIEAANGEDALAFVRENLHIDLILTDIRMPHLDGFGLALAARRLRPEIALVFMTGYSETVPPPTLRSEKILRKPFAPEELIATVQSLMQPLNSSDV